MLNFLFSTRNRHIREKEKELENIRAQRQALDEENRIYRCKVREQKERMEAFWRETVERRGQDNDD